MLITKTKKSNNNVIRFNLANLKTAEKKAQKNNNLSFAKYNNYKLKYNLSFVLEGSYFNILKYIYFWENNIQ